MRTPLPWRDAPGAGFTSPGATPWLPFGDVTACNVEDQRSDAGSILTLARDLILLRRQTRDLHSGAYASIPAPSGVWAWRRGDRFLAVVNMSEAETTLDGFKGQVHIGTDRQRDGERFAGPLLLRGWEGLVAETA